MQIKANSCYGYRYNASVSVQAPWVKQQGVGTAAYTCSIYGLLHRNTETLALAFKWLASVCRLTKKLHLQYGIPTQFLNKTVPTLY